LCRNILHWVGGPSTTCFLILSGHAGWNQAFYFRTYKKKPDVPKNKLILCAFAQVFSIVAIEFPRKTARNVTQNPPHFPLCNPAMSPTTWLAHK
jgi:hypothetical protein